VSGAVARDLPGQAERLVQLVKASTAVDWFEDWKVITLWIGGNDLCAVCNGPVQSRSLTRSIALLHLCFLFPHTFPRAYSQLRCRDLLGPELPGPPADHPRCFAAGLPV
jgi:hypothetical protein